MNYFPKYHRKFVFCLVYIIGIFVLYAQPSVTEASLNETPEIDFCIPPVRSTFQIMWIGELPDPELKKKEKPDSIQSPNVPIVNNKNVTIPNPSLQSPDTNSETKTVSNNTQSMQNASSESKNDIYSINQNIVPIIPSSKTQVLDTEKANEILNPALPVWKEYFAEFKVRFDIAIPGSGWTYLGEVNNNDGIKNESRRFKGSDAIFTFYPEKNGEYNLRFKRNDPVQNLVDDRIIKVIVKDNLLASENSGSAVNQDSVKNTKNQQAGSDVLPENGSIQVSPQNDSVVSVLSKSEESNNDTALILKTPDTVQPNKESLLAYAREEMAEKRYNNVILVLERYLRLFPSGDDEVFMMLAKLYETENPIRDIKKSLKYYKIIKDEYPRSKFWKEANDRAIYLERRYFDIR